MKLSRLEAASRILTRTLHYPNGGAASGSETTEMREDIKTLLLLVQVQRASGAAAADDEKGVSGIAAYTDLSDIAAYTDCVMRCNDRPKGQWWIDSELSQEAV